MATGTPYVSPQMLLNAPTGVAWKIIPRNNSTPAEQLAAATLISWQATSIVDTFCRQVLRATVDNEQLSGPGHPRVGIQRDTGNGLLIMRRWPVTQVLAVQIAQNAVFPRQWSTVPAGKYDVEHPLINAYTDSASATAPDGGHTILLAPCYIDWRYGRNGYRLLVSYTNGWPHTSLTQPANVGDTSIHVDDVTGWAGASGFAYDGANTETVAVSTVSATTPMQLPNGVGTAQTGPGTLTLSAPLTAAHTVGTVVSALPANVIQGATLAAVAQVMESGITSISAQNINPSVTTSGQSVADLQAEYELLLTDYQRVI